MPSARRLRLVFVGILATLIMTLVYSTQMRANDELDNSALNDFIQRTRQGLEKAHGGGAKDQTVFDVSKTDTSDLEDDAQLSKDMRERLKAAEMKAKDSANAKVLKPENPKQVIGVGSSAGGQGERENGAKIQAKETEEEHKVELIINDILKKAPVVIFSKTYCRYSKKAKSLLQKYTIEPEPFVVELDVHPMGKQIQDRLHEMTGRGTVPNIMVYGKTIGGFDEIFAMDKKNVLINKIQSLGSVGGKSIIIKNLVIKKNN